MLLGFLHPRKTIDERTLAATKSFLFSSTALDSEDTDNSDGLSTSESSCLWDQSRGKAGIKQERNRQ